MTTGPHQSRRCDGCGTDKVAYKLDGRFFCEVCGRDAAIVNATESTTTVPERSRKPAALIIEDETEAEASRSTSPTSKPKEAAVEKPADASSSEKVLVSRWKATSRTNRSLVIGAFALGVVVVCVVILVRRGTPSPASDQPSNQQSAAPTTQSAVAMDHPDQGTQVDQDLPLLGPITFSASSTNSAGPGYNFNVSNLVDNKLETSWQPKVSKNAWVRLEFAEELTLTTIEIANGFQAVDKLGDQFLLNSVNGPKFPS